MEESKTLKSNLIRYSLIIGFVSIVISILTYTLNEALMTKWWFGIFTIVVAIVLYVVAALSYRKDLGGYISFKQGFIFILLLAIFSTLIHTLYSLVQFNFIDPELGGRLQETIVQNSIAMMEKFNVPDEAIDEQVEKLQANNMFSNANIIKSFFINSLVGGVILGLIIGAIVKKKRPEELAV